MIDITIYPKINFFIEENEIRSLIEAGYINYTHNFSKDITLKLSEKDYTYFIEQILFATGKTVKSRKQNTHPLVINYNIMLLLPPEFYQF